MYVVHFIVYLSTLWVLLRAWTDQPKPKTLNKISCGYSTYRSRHMHLYSVSDMSVLNKQSIEPSLVSKAHFAHLPTFRSDHHLHHVICPTVQSTNGPWAKNVIIGGMPTISINNRPSNDPHKSYSKEQQATAPEIVVELIFPTYKLASIQNNGFTSL